MKKLNNKGFAISTVLYGLLIVLILITTLIITTMSSSRKISRQFTDNITRNLEKVPKSPLTNKIICLNEANSFVITEFDNKSLSKEQMCNNIISNLKERFFSICNDNKGSNCNQFLNQNGNGDWINALYSECNSNSSSKGKVFAIVQEGCCFYRTQSHDNSDFNLCNSGV